MSNAQMQSSHPRILKVLLATPVPPPHHGGIINWTRIVRNEFQTRPDVELSFVDTARRYRGIPGLPRLSRLLFGSAQAIRDSYRVYRRLKADRPDVLHLNTSAGPATIKDIVILRIAKWLGVPSLIHYRMAEAPYMVTGCKVQWKLMRFAMRLADAVITLDKRSEACVKAALPGHFVITLPNMVETQVIDDIRREGGCSGSAAEGCARVVFVGFVVPRKGVRELVEACARLPHSSLVLDLVGPVEPAMQRELESIASSSGRNGRWLRFHGAVDHAQALRHILAADVFVLPSRGESAPNVVLEAMGCGKAIVCTTVAAMPEMLDIGGPEECGVCVEPRSTDALAAALEQLLGDEDQRRDLGRKARQRAEKVYAVPVACAKLLDLWRSVAK
jgi:glycosyltransferase involved in cell wall biosynthesis